MKILHDIHTHNAFSACCGDKLASTDAFIAKEIELGNKIFGLSNHIWDENVKGASNWYSKQTIIKAEEAKASLAKAHSSLRCLFGAESEYFHCTDTLGMSLEGASRFDYMLIPHTHQHMRNYVMWDYPEIREAREKIAADIKQQCPYLDDDTVKIMSSSLKEAHLKKYVPEMVTDIGKYVTDAAVQSFNDLMANETFIKMCALLPTSVAHPFSLCGQTREMQCEYLKFISDETLLDCFGRAAKIGAHCEINIGAAGGNEQLFRLFAAAKKAGCKFTFGTDSHSVAGLENIKSADEFAEKLGLTVDDIADYLRDGVEA